MAKEFYGNISGKLGDKIYYMRMGKQCVRSVPAKRTRTVTQKRTAQQQKMILANQFAATIKQLIKISYPERHQLTPYNLLLKELLNVAISQSNDQYIIDYKYVRISRGCIGLPPGWNADGKGHTLYYSWSNSTSRDRRPDDRSILVAYCAALNQCIFITSGPDRSTGKAELDVAAFSGYEVHTWLGFVSENGKKAADSTYTGAVKVT